MASARKSRAATSDDDFGFAGGVGASSLVTVTAGAKPPLAKMVSSASAISGTEDGFVFRVAE